MTPERGRVAGIYTSISSGAIITLWHRQDTDTYDGEYYYPHRPLAGVSEITNMSEEHLQRLLTCGWRPLYPANQLVSEGL